MPSDIPALQALVRRVIAHLRAAGIDQWDASYPGLQMDADVGSGCAWLWKHDQAIVAYVAIDQNQDPKWDPLPWTDCSGRHRCIHRLMVEPATQGQGLGRQAMDWIEAQGQRQGWSSLRLDALAVNPISNGFYRRRGYVEIGRVLFRKGEACVYERHLRQDPVPGG